jgi:hypothetical protein
LVIIQDDVVKRILPRYEQISALNTNNIFIFAIETSPSSFQPMKTISKGDSNAGQAMIAADPESIQEPNLQTNFLSDKKGANELSKKLKQGYIQVIANF